MFADGVQHLGEGQEVTPHSEDQEQQLCSAQHLPTEGAHQDLTGVRHAVDMGVSKLELPQRVSGIGC